MGSVTWPLFFLCLVFSAALFGKWFLGRPAAC